MAALYSVSLFCSSVLSTFLQCSLFLGPHWPATEMNSVTQLRCSFTLLILTIITRKSLSANAFYHDHKYMTLRILKTTVPLQQIAFNTSSSICYFSRFKLDSNFFHRVATFTAHKILPEPSFSFISHSFRVPLFRSLIPTTSFCSALASDVPRQD